MLRSRNESTTRLCVEQLEPRDLLAAWGIANDLILANMLNGVNDLSGAGFPNQISTVAAATAFGNPLAVGFGTTPGIAVVLTNPDPNMTLQPTLTAPDAATGVGQMTITTGANTPGIGSFATSTLGYASENGGRSGG